MQINPDAWVFETCNVTAKQALREKIKTDVEAYLAKGKKIKVAPTLPNTVARHKKQILSNMRESVDQYGDTMRGFQKG